MAAISYSDLQKYTGIGYQAIRRRLEDANLKPVGYGDGPGKAILWDSAKALEAIYAPMVAQGEGLDPQQEKALLDKARREAQEMKNAELAGKLLDAEAVERDCFNFARTARDAMQALPDKLSAVLAHMSDQHEVHEYLRTEIRAALFALADKFSGGENDTDS